MAVADAYIGGTKIPAKTLKAGNFNHSKKGNNCCRQDKGSWRIQKSQE